MVVNDDRRPVVNKAGAAYRVDTTWATRHAAKTKRMGDATAFDAEMKALAMGLKKCNNVADEIETGDDRHPPREVKNLVIYSDSMSAMCRMLQPDKLGASQLQAIGCCKSIRTFLEKRPNRRVILRWCPSHQDVAENEDVDRMAKQASGSNQQPQRLPTWSVAKQRIREHASEIWHRKMMDSKYMGHQALLRFDEVGKMRTKAKSHLPFKLAAGIDLTASDSSWDTNQLFARYVRFFTGHGPSGEFRLRFGHDNPWHCPCDDVARPLDTRDHALYECPMWTRDFARPVDDPLTIGNVELEYGPPEHPHVVRAKRQQITQKDIVRFLKANPQLWTFDWASMVARRSLEREIPIWTSDTQVWMILATVTRQEAYLTWQERTCGGNTAINLDSLIEFNSTIWHNVDHIVDQLKAMVKYRQRWRPTPDMPQLIYVKEMWHNVGYTPPSNCPPRDRGFVPWFLWDTDKYGRHTRSDDTWHPDATGRDDDWDNPVLANPRPHRQPVEALW
jgi:ribonuclease HI